jgi:hypothetical protein
MFAGHMGAGLVLGSAARDVNVGVFIAAALLLDFLLWLFVLLGWESVTIPADFARHHQAEFAFPYSHGLLSSVAWSAAAAGVARVLYSGPGRWRAAALIGAAVLSHWVLDAVVHRPELPLAGLGSRHVGLGLWNDMPVALAVESTLVLAGVVCWFTFGSRPGRYRRIALGTLTAVVMVFTAIGMTEAPAPPSPIAMAASSLVTLAGICALALWLGKAPART